MTRCNYIALDTDLDPLSPYLDELFDLDILCTEEGILINIDEDTITGRRRVS
jgi:hypothetical protein